MKSLKEAGLVARPPFVKANDLAELDIHFVILNATLNPNGYNPGQREVVFAIRCLNVREDQMILDADGNDLTALKKLSMSLAATPSREEYVTYFRDPDAEPLGPLCFEKVPPRKEGLNPFLLLVDYVPLVANGRPIQRHETVPVTRLEFRPEPDDTDVPF